MIASSSIIQYNTSDIKRALDTKITEFSNEYYDYLPYPSYKIELPNDVGPFWKRDFITVKWDYSEPLDNLIPLTNIYFGNNVTESLIIEDVVTSQKVFSYSIPQILGLDNEYYFKVATVFDGKEIFATSSKFTLDERTIEITTEPPEEPIVANAGNDFVIDWNGHGASDYVNILLVDATINKSIEYEGEVGRLISNPNQTVSIIDSSELSQRNF